LPKTYEGLDIKAKIAGGLPEEFKSTKNNKPAYVWAPQHFELFVDRCAPEIKERLGNPKMSRKEMLDALAFGDFEAHKKKAKQLMTEGKVPPFKLN